MLLGFGEIVIFIKSNSFYSLVWANGCLCVKVSLFKKLFDILLPIHKITNYESRQFRT